MGNERLLESKTLVASMEDRAVQYESLKKQFVSLKNAFQKIVDLDGFKGQGARAIKGFYQGQIEVVDSWIAICEVKIAFFNGVSGATEDVDLSGETLVQVPFLQEELYTGHTQSKEMVDSQQKSLKSIFDRIIDLVSLQPFSKEDFEEKIDQANKKRKDTMEQVVNLDEGLVEEYANSEYQENMMIGLFSALLDATSQGSTISPINFDVHAYKNSEVYNLREDAQSQTDAYLEFKEQQEEQRRIQKEMEELENRPWYEKAWDAVSTFTGEVTGYYDMKRASTGVDPITGEELSEAERVKAATFAAAGFIPFVGWAGRAAKGGNAIYKTAKGVQAVDHSLDVYKNAKAFTTLQKTEYGIYGLASANGFSEYITGKDMFGNELSEEKRNSSLTEALFVLGVGGAGAYVDRLQAGNAVYRTPHNIYNDPNDKTCESVKMVIQENGYSVSKFKKLLHPDTTLTQEEMEIVRSVRQQIGIPTADTVMAKTIPQSDIYKYLYNPKYKGVRGFTAVKEHSSNLDSIKDHYEGARLDYNNSPYKLTKGIDGISISTGAPDKYYGVVEYKLNDPNKVSIPFGEPKPEEYPYTGRGFTGSEKVVLPEYYQEPRDFVHGDELRIMDAKTGDKAMTLIFDKKIGWNRID